MSEYVADEKEAHRSAYKVGTDGERYALPSNLQDVFTPWSLAGDIVGKLDKVGGVFGKTFLTFNLEFVEVLMYDFGVKGEDIWFVSDCSEKIAFGSLDRYNGLNKVEIDLIQFLEEGLDMKFDVVIMNPPYQAQAKEGGQKGSRSHIWHDFVEKSLSLVKEGGYVCNIHPGGWRVDGKFKKCGNKLKEKDIKYLNINSIEECQKVFKVTQQFDWYILQNREYSGETIINDEEGKETKVNLLDFESIPNFMIDEVYKLIAKNGEEKVNFIADCSSYEHRREWVLKEKTDTHIYPVVYSLPQKGEQIWWSSRNDKGHFGIPKVIWSNGAATQILIDEKGEYGMTEWAYAIADEPKNLPLIKKAMESEKFLKLCGCMSMAKYDRFGNKFIKHFKKDWWKEFV